MEDNKKVICKVEKRSELATNAHNVRLHLEGDTFGGKAAGDIFRLTVRESYYVGRPHELLILAIRDPEHDVILKNGLKFNYEKLLVSITRDRKAGNHSELYIISTTLGPPGPAARSSQRGRTS